MRGERSSGFTRTLIGDGSSPHTRGTLIDLRERKHESRFIPACAGNAPGHPGPAPGVPVHPRMRGERSHVSRQPCSISGSSPHARGTPAAADGKTFRDRFIPACAGNASPHRPRRSPATVHPRMRGERFTEMGCFTPRSGSSPHARGTPMLTWVAALLLRFIPACAGNALPVSY